MSQRKKPHVHPVDEAWLALGTEAPIEPAIEIVDSHIHLWDFSDPAYFVADYERDARAAGIVASVYVDCTMAYRDGGPVAMEPVGEVEFASAQADQAGDGVAVAQAIVGWADLTLGDAVDPVLDALELAGRGRFRGVRARATYDPDPIAGYGETGAPAGLLARADFRCGVARLHDRGHVLDVYAFHTQLGEVADLARAFPDLPIILNHIGGPIGVGAYADKPVKVFADWMHGIDDVATCPNVVIKIGGFAISRIGIVKAQGRARPFSSKELADAFRPWVDHCFAEFGPERCLFGSNFPVDKVAFPLVNLVNAMKILLAGHSVGEQRAFFAGNARKIYKIQF
ncbi:amidohydrolase [Novosphingobium sp. Fuku2-ISO-50]|uniref:amidohydrolase family protein n=1 Tax=Novosphingobium sp. Fuku2-ISO-50 TaxID=1739114 RepID=UPI00076CDB7B|nr:amidohydrolase family protein [Novosphingobium sp. Fuku2-ISO-50]KUR73250.1 hypothetical protein AQZ50_19365 [Novosphingobium sp. Fuku2-ISO-50]